jgi:hypothetical protein
MLGDDDNSGLTSQEPMKTINLAIRKIASDSLEPKTVHLMEGWYSVSLNQPSFPIGMKSYTKLIGENEATTIVHGEYSTSRLIRVDRGMQNCLIKNITFTNSQEDSGVIGIYRCKNVTIQNVTVKNVISQNNGAIQGSSACENVKLDNVKLLDNTTFGRV